MNNYHKWFFLREEEAKAQTDAQAAKYELEELEYELLMAVNYSDVKLAGYEEALQELEAVTEQFNAKLVEFHDIEAKIANLSAGDKDIDTLRKDSSRIEAELILLNESLIKSEFEVMNLLDAVNSTSETVKSLEEMLIEQNQTFEELNDFLIQKQANVTVALDVLQKATDRYNSALLDWQDRTVPTPVTCTHDGDWFVPGNPYCLGK